MEKIIGSILMAGSIQNSLLAYQIFFTDDKIIAIGKGNLPIGGMRPLQSAIEWEKIVQEINDDNTSNVEYTSELSDEMQKGSNVIKIEYSKIKEVMIKRESRDSSPQNKLQYSIKFDAGFFSTKSFLIPGVSVDETIKLVKQTPLAGNLLIK